MYPEPPHRAVAASSRPYPAAGPGPGFLDAPGQPVGHGRGGGQPTGTTVDAGYLTSSGGRAALTDTAQRQLAAIAGSRRPVTRRPRRPGPLPGGRGPQPQRRRRHRHRPVDVQRRRHHDADAADLRRSSPSIALVAATTAGIVIIRRALAPLRRVAQTASKVADLPLDRGEVELPVRVRESDANPRTEVGQLGSALNQMLDHIAAALSARQASETRVRQFVADASHELRTPLAAIRGYTELAQRMGDDREAVAHAMSRVASETERMTRLVEDLLLLARLDSGRPLEREPVDLSRLAVDAVSDAHVAGPDHQWELDLPEEPVVVPATRPGCTRC